ncbi:hypothetical protein Snoj_36900 [Streptomyces nojiriensis]|uniref:Secreted protein n=1 Tax=Streptomyces nojiriensis TaxID=66374 RepID=A0ABQ3SNZ7_9ACTN|nr:hypothetical protein GCM10010205_47270 [Streptomyces nojiriensis]GHI69772.1 hypothetical protein Snoj_36900 [Streptomyces nojiriensis]
MTMRPKILRLSCALLVYRLQVARPRGELKPVPGEGARAARSAHITDRAQVFRTGGFASYGRGSTVPDQEAM